MRPLFLLGVVIVIGWAIALVVLGFPDGIINLVPFVGLGLLAWDWVTLAGDPLAKSRHGTLDRDRNGRYDPTVTTATTTTARGL